MDVGGETGFGFSIGNPSINATVTFITGSGTSTYTVVQTGSNSYTVQVDVSAAVAVSPWTLEYSAGVNLVELGITYLTVE